ncbi:MAG: UDP-3-O-(3-hydroxymyristoyl)glucosamine N-acyltransferase [Puniceicoccales bacterium]|jgi:UDP-3-O-[3-hydroxymyristoyl] glucosamine N-acyltransferase|nr:UDP-3-O-(3-hydroxymyristoyl)glucosamine N-acyltransferase [Puniceicoccales bacterium]
MRYDQEELEKLLSPEIVKGRCWAAITGISSLESANLGDLSFLSNGKYASLVSHSRASILLLPQNFSGEPPEGVAYFFLPDPSMALGKLCAAVEGDRKISLPSGVHPTAIVAATANIHPTSSIGPFCVLGEEVTVGPSCTIGSHCTIGPRCTVGEGVRFHPRVTLYCDCTVGARSIIHSGAVLGSDGYGYSPEADGHRKLPHIGGVIIEEDVEIGANSCVDRARFAMTRIGKGTKIDNLVQIAHNVEIGQNSLLVAQVGIAGSTKIGEWVVLAGQAGVAGHLTVGSRVRVAAQGGVSSDVADDTVVRGTPAMPIGEANRFFVLRRRIPELFRRVEAIEGQLGGGNSLRGMASRELP